MTRSDEAPFASTNETTEWERQELRDAGPVMIHQHKGKVQCLCIAGETNQRVMLTALRVLREAMEDDDE